MRTQISLGGSSSDLNSRRLRQELINGYVELNDDGSFRRIRRAQGLKDYVTVGSGPIRGLKSVRNELFVVSGSELYLVTPALSVTLLGNVGGASSISYMDVNGTEARELLVVSGGSGFIWDGTVFQQITDPSFEPDVSVTTLDQRFWLNIPDTNIFFRSEVADGLNYNPLDRASAETQPDEVKFVATIKTTLWVFGGKSVEPWQSDAASELGVRRVAGGTIDRGLASKFSVAQWEDKLFWLADDKTVWMLSSTTAKKISDIEFETAIRGDGTDRLPGYKNIQNAEGFFIEHPTHKMYCLTFPGDGVTWVLDLATGLWHKRSTREVRRWRARLSQLFDSKIIVGDYSVGKLYILSEEQCDSCGESQDFEIVCPPIHSGKSGITVSEIELIADFAQSDNRQIMLSTSKDGGLTYTNTRQLSFGPIGANHRAIGRAFGRTPRHQEFVTRWRVTDSAPIDIYEQWMDVEEGI